MQWYDPIFILHMARNQRFPLNSVVPSYWARYLEIKCVKQLENEDEAALRGCTLFFKQSSSCRGDSLGSSRILQYADFLGMSTLLLGWSNRYKKLYIMNWMIATKGIDVAYAGINIIHIFTNISQRNCMRDKMGID